MSVVLWYRIEIAAVAALAGTATGPGLPITISNDVQSGSTVADADITVTMSDAAAAGTFEVSVIDLPASVTELIKKTHAARPLNATVHLGYFDEPSTQTGASQVLVGRIMSVTSGVGDDGLARTVLHGQEEGGYLLRNTPAELGPAPGVRIVDLTESLAKAAGVGLAGGSSAGEGPADFTVRSGSVLDALAEIAARADVPMVLRDRQVHLGDAVGAPADRAPVVFDPDTNLVALSSSTAEDTAPRAAFRRPPAAGRPPVRTTLELTVLGHPGLRPGQVATMAGLSGMPTGPLRISRVVHCFHVDSGYTAQLRLISAEQGKRAQVATELQGLVDRVRGVVDRGRADHPAIDMGEVSGYVPAGHRASLRYGQTPEPGVTGPSVASPVGSGAELHEKPISSPFAFHKTGLIVPVYPGMRAVLAHNDGQVDDAMVAGFVWAEERQRPQGKRGDYWLALPTELGKNGLPQGKGVNDLTDAGGHRVIQAAALHLVVGAGRLPEVGVRPEPPTGDSITIDHHSGTTIRVDSAGAVTISTEGKPITLTNGSVSMKLDGSAVAVT
ncbi:hypothetical protein [Amycolatopsis nigrescens]|uniref:hypothetical protein n=1 Tax=Amycolatopsis nigrescens TaxID=381445 RepID=UPI0003639093|nr:hypothetical protein [Amycolatopsis nigrescens]